MDTPLKRVRRTRDLTQEEVASAVGIKQGYYSRLENGEATASPATAAKLAEYFRDDLDELDILYPHRSGAVA